MSSSQIVVGAILQGLGFVLVIVDLAWTRISEGGSFRALAVVVRSAWDPIGAAGEAMDMVVKDLAEKTDAKKMDDARVATAREDLAKALALLEKGIGEREETDKAVRTRSQILST